MRTYKEFEELLNTLFPNDDSFWLFLYDTRGMRLYQILDLINKQTYEDFPLNEEWFSDYIDKRFPDKAGVQIDKVVKVEYYNWRNIYGY